jgi:hypothetical protein
MSAVRLSWALLSSVTKTLRTVFDAIVEAREQRALIEAELYRGRYKHSSKLDDDLPIVRW